MTITVLVPNWTATAELEEFASMRRGLGYYTACMWGYDLVFSPALGCDVIQIRDPVSGLPPLLQDVDFAQFIIIKHNSPVTMAPDGYYVDGEVTARVETYIKDRVRMQTIKVTGASLDGTNDWFDSLLAGERNNCCARPITYPVTEDSQDILPVDGVDAPPAR